MRFIPHEYQRRMIQHVLDHPRCALFAEMGLGKTATTLSALGELMDMGLVARTLVVAPKSVARNTWTAELRKWDNLSWITAAVAMGTPAQRSRALRSGASVIVTNVDNYAKVCTEAWDAGIAFDCLVLDESSLFKSHSSERFKFLRRWRERFPRIVELTGTPAPNGLMDLWSQMFILDGGRALGTSYTAFQQRWFYPLFGNGYVTYRWGTRKGADREIAAAMEPLCLSMRSEDYVHLPDCRHIDIDLEPDDSVARAYRQFVRDMVAELDGETVMAANAAAMANKLLQFTGGFVYDDERTAHRVHGQKLEALADLVEQAGSPVLVFYGYRSEVPAMAEALKAWSPEVFDGSEDQVARWNEGKVRVLLAHPASMAYGLNLQQGGHIAVWYTLTWNLELYLQANARLHRQGQQQPVMIYHIGLAGTIDQKVRRALETKESIQDVMMDELK